MDKLLAFTDSCYSIVILGNMNEADDIDIGQLLSELPYIFGESDLLDAVLSEDTLHAQLGQEPEPDVDDELPPDYHLATPWTTSQTIMPPSPSLSSSSPPASSSCDDEMSGEDERVERQWHDGYPPQHQGQPLPSNVFEAHLTHDTEVRHPCGLVDYHLYLTWLERGSRGETAITRLNSTYLLDIGTGSCYPISYEELLANRHHPPLPSQDGGWRRLDFNGYLLSHSLPVPADHAGTASGFHYILAYDICADSLLVRAFDVLPGRHDLPDLWPDGTTLARLTVQELYSVMHRSIQLDESDGNIVVSPTRLTAPEKPNHHRDELGMEIVLAVLLCRWVGDFADILKNLPDGDSAHPVVETIKGDMFRAAFEVYATLWRLVLARASCRLWSSSCSGAYNEDLLDYRLSYDVGELLDENWVPQTLEECEEMRSQLR